MTPRVLVLATLARLGGAERSLLELVRRLRDALAFTIVLPEDGPLAAAAETAGAEVRIVPWPDALAELGERTRSGGRLVALARAAATIGVLRIRLRAEIDRLAPDVVLTNGIKAHVLGALACDRTDAPLVWYAREGLEDRPLSRIALRLLGRRCAGVVAISRYVAGEFRPLVPGPASVHVVRNIVDPGRLHPGMALPDDLRKETGDVWLGVVGALTPLKGQDVFLDAAARVVERVPGVHFLIVGGEPYRTESRLGYAAALEKRVRALGLEGRVDLLGERDDAPAVIANLDVLVQPSRGPEGLGRTILEAMACAVPVIAVDRWGPREIVDDGETGLLVPPGDVAALADAMIRLGADPALRVRLGAAGRDQLLASGEPARLARAFQDALAAIADLSPARPAVTRPRAASGGGR
jgi:glycosyltransferase involved in cell wall biosynthesis